MAAAIGLYRRARRQARFATGLEHMAANGPSLVQLIPASAAVATVARPASIVFASSNSTPSSLMRLRQRVSDEWSIGGRCWSEAAIGPVDRSAAERLAPEVLVIRVLYAAGDNGSVHSL